MRLNKSQLIIIFSILLVCIVLILNKSKEQIITKELYDELYNQQPTWSINQFPTVNNSYNGSSYAWGWSYVGNSLIDMYKATGEKKYLEYFVQQVKYIFTQTDKQLGIESFSGSGVSLPAWSDQGKYTSGEFNYIYPVHTGMITVPILRFIDEVRSNKLEEYMEIADSFLENTGEALAIHNQDNMWVDFSNTEGFYIGHSYGVGIVSEAGKIGVPNRISIYLAAAGLYDKLTEGSTYTERIEKSLNYFKYSLMKYDEEYDSYYWSYWEEDILGKPWEDISHAAVTAYGLFLLHEEAGFSIFSNEDFEKIANNVYKVIEDRNGSIMTRKYLHEKDEEEKLYYRPDENPYYYDILRWAFLGTYDEEILDLLEKSYVEMNTEDMLPQTRLASLASYLYTKEKTKGIKFW